MQINNDCIRNICTAKANSNRGFIMPTTMWTNILVVKCVFRTLLLSFNYYFKYLFKLLIFIE